MDRRQVLLLTAGIAGLAASPAFGQQRRTRKIGVLWHAGTPEEEAIYQQPLKAGLSDLGYVEGRDYDLVETYADEKYERFNANATKLVEMQVDVIVAVTGPATAAAQRATTTLPIVFVVVPDPVGRRFAASLARPGGNITGLSTISVDLSPKRLELLKQAFPDTSRVSLFVNAKDPHMSRSVVERTQAAAASLGVTVDPVEIADPDDLDRAFPEVRRKGTSAAILMQDPLFFNERRRIAKLALSNRVGTMVANSVMVDDGSLMSYGANSGPLFRRVGLYVDKIFRGEGPAQIPIEEPTRLELVINLRTADALGVSIAPSLLALADRTVDLKG
jgi:putative tryptophan/tyrosine transport system substrate-binding protein